MAFAKMVFFHPFFSPSMLIISLMMDSVYAGAVCYADDLVLLALSPFALWIMLNCYVDFAMSCGLKFNTSKTQLIR